MPKIETARKAGLGKKKASGPYIIPVVFHILTDGTNINRPFTKAEMKCRIDAAIEVCNKDFNDLYNNVYPDPQNPGFKNEVSPLFAGVRSKLDIQFVAATVDPEGNLLEYAGMDWHPDAHISYGYDPKIYDFLYYGQNGKYYLDVLVVDEPNRIGETNGSGHAFLPVQDTRPRVTYNHRYIGNTCGSQADFQFAKEMSHEFGHYFGLKHTFDQGSSHKNCDPVNDGMADTPLAIQEEWNGVATLDQINSCGVIANYQNLMDYNVRWQRMFTKDQTDAMTYWLEDTKNEAKYSRRLLWQPSNLMAVGIIPAVPKAKFTVSTTTICPNKPVSFKDLSTGLPTLRNWTFEGGTPSISTEINPSVSYAAAGTYTVTLTVTNALGNDTKTITSYIKVGEKLSTNVVEDFSGVFPPQGWAISNPDNGYTWEERKDVGNGDSSCMVINNSDNGQINDIDYIQLPYYNFTNGINSQLYFDVAYTKFDKNSPDVLDVEVSTDCGSNWVSVYSKTHTVLETTLVDNIYPNYWIPTIADNWRREVIDLKSYIGNPNVTIRFKNKSGYGTRIWIDNVNVAIVQSTTPVSDFSAITRKTNCSNMVVPFVDVSTGNPTEWLWSFPGGTPATSTIKDPVVTYSTQGSYNVSLITKNNAGEGTRKEIPNFVTVATPVGISFTEDFGGVFPPVGWEIKNLNANLTWEKSTAAGKSSSSCMIMNNADNSKKNDVDEIILQPLDLSIGVTDFSFDVAYAKFDDKSPDALDVFISKDCGITWTNLYSKTLSVLETAVSNDANNWIPKLDSDWRTERISLVEFKGNSNVLIKFVNTSGYGARIWIDNVKFTFDSKEKPIPDFIVAGNSSCSGLPIQFSGLSTGEPISWSWTFQGGTPATSMSQNPSVVYDKPGSYSVSLVTTNVFGTGSVVKNNFITLATDAVPFSENFSNAFPIDGWQIINPDNAITWEKREDVGKGDLSCLIINDANNKPKYEDKDEMIMKSIDLSTIETPYLHFDLAYTQCKNYFHPEYNWIDMIDILVSSDCGVSWTNVYSKDQKGLQTVSPPIEDDPATDDLDTNNWIPTHDSDWRNELVDLSIVKNQPNVLIKFKNTSGYGSVIWFDNFNINDSPEADPIGATISQTPVTCNGGNTGSATVVATGGTGTLTYLWSPSGGTTATATGLTQGEYTCTIKDASLRTLIKKITVEVLPIDVSVSISSGILKVNQVGASYQWFKCPGTAIVDAVKQSYTPVEIGEYKVEVTSNGCSATSDCITLSTLGTSDFEASQDFVVYPNPSSGIVYFKSDSDGAFNIINEVGQTIKTFKVKSEGVNMINLEQLSEGVYYIHGKRDNKKISRKLIIKK